MNIGLDASFLARDFRGMGRATKSLLNFMLSDHNCKFSFLFPLHEKDELKVKKMYSFAPVNYLPVAEADKLDLIWFPWGRVDFFPKSKRLATIYDLAPYHFFPRDKLDSYNDRKRIKQAAEAADIIVTSSEFSKGEIVDFLSVSPNKVAVIPLSADETFLPASPEGVSAFLNRFSEGAPYILFVGNLEKRKNLKTLLWGFDELKKEFHYPHKLLIVAGKPVKTSKNKFTDKILSVLGKKFDADPLPYIYENMEFKKDVYWLGTVSDNDLAKLYGLASAFVFPSLYEGFGIPLLEAFACAAPVIASDIPVFREIGGDAPVYFQPKDPCDLASKIHRVLSSNAVASSMRARGIERLKYYSWKSSYLRYMEIFRSLV